jgi:hypothetical protein
MSAAKSETLKERKRPLFEKSGAKTSFMLGSGHCPGQRPWPSINKVFLLLFVHKKKPYFSLALGMPWYHATRAALMPAIDLAH